MRLQIQSTEALVDIAYQIRPTVGESRIPPDNKIAAKGLRGKEENKPFKLYSLPNPLITLCIYPRPAQAFWGPNNLTASHFNLQPIHWSNTVTASTVERWCKSMSGMLISRLLVTVYCCCFILYKRLSATVIWIF